MNERKKILNFNDLNNWLHSKKIYEEINFIGIIKRNKKNPIIKDLRVIFINMN